MKINLIYLGLVVGILTIGCKTIKPYGLSERTYRDYVLYRCLERGLGTSPFSKDLSLGIYSEITEGSITEGPIAHYLDSLVARKVDSIPVAQVPGDGRKVIFMICMDYYNSPQLRHEIKKVMKMSKERERKGLEDMKKAIGKKRPLPSF